MNLYMYEEMTLHNIYEFLAPDPLGTLLLGVETSGTGDALVNANEQL